MNTSLNWTRLLIGCLFLALITGCATAAQETPIPEPMAIPTNTSKPPTPSPEPTEITFEVTLDGSECTFSGPAEVPKGYINVAFDNKGDNNFGPWVDHFLDGKTYQDFLDEIHVEPEVSHPEPDWVDHPFYFTKDHEVWIFTLKETGEHAIFVGSYTPWREYPCGKFQVIEAPSE